ncbi:MAG: hypothetical protein ABR499_12865 [Gemmatimonadaceae bacterium]
MTYLSPNATRVSVDASIRDKTTRAAANARDAIVASLMEDDA